MEDTQLDETIKIKEEMQKQAMVAVSLSAASPARLLAVCLLLDSVLLNGLHPPAPPPLPLTPAPCPLCPPSATE